MSLTLTKVLMSAGWVIWLKNIDFVRSFSLWVRRNISLLVCSLIVLFLGIVVYACASGNLFSATIQSRGVVKSLGVGVYWDEACRNPVSSLDWGVVEPGAHKNFTFYVRNEGNVPGVLSLSAVNWNPPAASSYMTLTWDYSGDALEPNKVVLVTLTLFISPDIEGVITFNFETLISIG